MHDRQNHVAEQWQGILAAAVQGPLRLRDPCVGTDTLGFPLRDPPVLDDIHGPGDDPEGHVLMDGQDRDALFR